jgi:hypothetical protein
MEQRKFFFRKADDYQKIICHYQKIITEGFFEDIIRSPNNPHGVLLKNWRIIDNEELSNQTKTPTKMNAFLKQTAKMVGMGVKNPKEVFHLFDGFYRFHLSAR